MVAQGPKVTKTTKPPKYKPGQKVTDALLPILGKTLPRATENKAEPGALDFIRQGFNFGGDILTGGRNARQAVGTGFGDTLFGVKPGYYKNVNANEPDDIPVFGAWFGRQNNSPVASGGKKTGRGLGNGAITPNYMSNGFSGGGGGSAVDTGDGWNPMSLQDALNQVRAMMKADGYDDGSVSYDPLRNAARAQWSDADARTLAMYQQLQTAIGEDAGTIKANYDAGVDDTNKATEFANQQNLQSAQGMNSMQSQQAAALGIQEAVGNDIQAGNYAARDALDRTADTTARGQITSNLLNSNKAASLDYNTDLVGAAGLQGTMVRNQRQNELNRMLAQYDVDEQAANRDARQNRQNQEFSLAQFLMGTDRDDFAANNALQRGMTQDANEQQRWEYEQMMQGAGGETGYNALTARQQALKDYGWTEKDVKAKGDSARDLILKRSMQYLGL